MSRFTMLILLFIPLALQAEEPSKDGARFLLPDVTVTSQGDSEDYLEVPARIDTLSKEAVEKDRVRFAGDVLQKVPGVYIREVNPLVPSLGVRLPANFNSPYYLTTVDQIPLISAINSNHASLSFLPIATGAGGLEVLKGTPSILYGSDAITAVVNLRSPEFGEGKTASLDVGQRNFQRIKVSATGPIDDKQAYYGIINVTKDNGWREKQAGTRGESILRHRKKLDSGTTMTTTLFLSSLRSQDAGYLNYSTYQNSPEQSGISIEDPYERNYYARLATEFKIPLADKSALTITPYLRYNNGNYVAFWNTSTLPETNVFEKTLGLRTSYKMASAQSETVFGLDLEATSLSYKEEQTLPTVAGSTASADLPRGVHYNYDVFYTSVSPFATQAWFFAEKWRWDIGIRGDMANSSYTNNTQDGTCSTTANTNGQCGNFLRVGNRTDPFSGLSPKTGISYRLSRSESFFGNIGTGFKVPATTTLYNLVSGQQSPNLKPERSLTFELGYKLDNGSVGLDLSLYQTEIQDRVVRSQGTVNELATFKNAGKSCHQGVELGSAWKASSEFLLGLSAAVSRNVFIEYTTSGTDYSGKTESQAPARVIDARFTYQPKFLPGFETSIELNHISSYWVEDSNQNEIQGRDIFNIRADYDISKLLHVNLRVMNLTNVKYPSDVANFGSLFYRPGMPFTAYAGMDYKF